MNEIILGKIVSISPDYGIRVEAPYSRWETLALRGYENVQVVLTDSRLISPKQREAIFATVHDIAEFVEGYAYKNSVIQKLLAELELQWLIDIADSEELRYWLTWNYCKLTETPFFSLSPLSSNCADMTTARDFLGWLIDFCITHGVPTSGRLIDRAEDIGRYLYACILHGRCCISGRKGELHHVDRVGAGRNRRKINHLGMRAECISRQYHIEVDQIGQEAFDEKYHIYGIKLDETLCKARGLGYGGV
jgi:hypothetical protein